MTTLHMKKIGAIVQARMSSTRLPEKVLLNLPYNKDTSVLQQVVRRLKRCDLLDTIIVATTTNKIDDRIVENIKTECDVFRGSEHDVLSRYYESAKRFGLDIIVRITSDCPCVDPEIVHGVISTHVDCDRDYTSNTILRTFPRGMDVEVFNVECLEKAHFEAKKPHQREHVTPFLYENPEMFQKQQVVACERYKRPDLRLTIDTTLDYAFLCCVFDEMYSKIGEFFILDDIVRSLDEKPWLLLINKDVVQKTF